MITIIDYGTGNLRSIENMLRVLGYPSVISCDPHVVRRAERIILPGVGHFDYGMRQLRERGLIDALNDVVLTRSAPILGICLGAQLLTRGSEEGNEPGLCWIAAETRRFDRSRLPESLRIPHMGWADTEYDASHPLFYGFKSIPRFYYVHSYHMVCDEPGLELSHANYGYRFVSGVARDNIAGVQFHPEKSHRFGKVVLANFADWNLGKSGDSRS
ncbi:MAG: imidazole glycerol phosphate synthase subunit HisH [Planctomycetes bacterium]|nr:imidazole glycerol phosphate synthase subunit HisH [Planctomycetota bacterium]